MSLAEDLKTIEALQIPQRVGSHDTRYVYLLSTYGEYGAEEVVATLNRETLLMLVDVNWSDVDTSWRDEVKQSLETLLLADDTMLAETREGHECTKAWGGVQLHVVPLT